MRGSFARAVLGSLVAEGAVATTDRVLAVCAGQQDQALFDEAGLTDVCLTNLDVVDGINPHGKGQQADGARWERADAQDLPFPTGAFDWAWVSDGIHHCRSPHRAVTEMYRVSRKGVIVVESRDSLAVQVANRVGLSPRYEINGRLLQTRRNGGVDFGPVPNFIYRWTEAEFEKLVSCYDPEHRCSFEYFYGLTVPTGALGSKARAVGVAARCITRVAPRQGNTFGMVARKGPLAPYLEEADGGSVGLADGVRDRRGARAALRLTPAAPRVRHHVR